jgi:hypothetical protein
MKDVTALALVDRYPIAKQTPEAAAALMKANLGGINLGANDLEKVGVPHGGQIAFTVPTMKGDKTAEYVEGIIVAHRNPRAKYDKPFDPRETEKAPPSCASADGIRGNGIPGGLCQSCPDGGFTDGMLPKCAAKLELYLLMEGRNLPVRVSLPATSLAIFKKFFVRLTSGGSAFYSVVVRLESRADKSRGGYACTRIEPRVIDEVPADILPTIEAFSQRFEAILAGPAPQAEDVEVDEE